MPTLHLVPKMHRVSTLKVVLIAGLAASAARLVIWAVFGVSVLIWPEGEMILLADFPSVGAALLLGRLGVVCGIDTYFDPWFLALAQATWFLLGALVGVTTVYVVHRRGRAVGLHT